MLLAEVVIAAVVALLVVITVMRSVRIVPQARARNVERLGRYRKTLEPGMNFVIPMIDRVKPIIDLREQVVSFNGAPVITADNLVVLIDTVLFFQVTDPRAADYEIVNYIQAIDQITATMLRSVIGSMDLEQTLTSRDKINTLLRGVLGALGGANVDRQKLFVPGMVSYLEACPRASYLPEERIRMLDEWRVDQGVLFPTVGILWDVADDELAAAYARAYNNWIHEFAAGAPGRVIPIAHLALQDPVTALAELRRCLKLGFKGIFLAPSPLTWPTLFSATSWKT